MFARANMDEQRHRLMETLGLLIAELHNPEQLVVDLVALGRRHIPYGVRDSDYDSAGAFVSSELSLGVSRYFHSLTNQPAFAI